MQKSFRTAIMTWFRGTAVAAGLLLLALRWPVALRSQPSPGEKLVSARNDIERITDAVLISDVAVENKTVECGLFIKPPLVIQPVTPFQASNDWVQHMNIFLVNRTSKVIVRGSMILRFLDTGDCSTPSSRCIQSVLEFGRLPAVDAYSGRTGQPLKPERLERPPLDWRPEQTIAIHVSDYIAEIKEDSANLLPVNALSKLNIYRGVFYFDDGMVWSLGRYAVPDPDRPGKFKELSADYFPGRRGNNWPPGYEQ